jgi:hypothetical protein
MKKKDNSLVRWLKLIKTLAPFLVILILSWWAVKPLFHSGFYSMHDDEQVARLHQLDLALKDGQIPPRWVSDLGFGFGFPLFNFYPPLFYYLGEVFHLLGISLISSTKIALIVSVILSGFLVYLFAFEFLGSLGGVVSALFYVYAPYRAVDLYVRGAASEAFSFVFLPALLLSFYNLIIKSKREFVCYSALALAGLMLAHNLIFLLFVPFLICYLLFLLIWKRKLKNLFYLGAAFLLGMGLSTYFWLPSLLEREYTLVDQILTGELADFRLHFVYLRQFWHSPWGYGGSLFGLEDGVSFEIGKIHLLAVGVSPVLIFRLLRRGKKHTPLFLFFVFCFAFSVFLTSFHSQSLWEAVSPFSYLQFPWRFLTVVVLFASLLAGSLPVLFSNQFIKSAVAICLVSLVIITNKNFFKPERFLAVDDAYYTSAEVLKWRTSRMSYDYVPRGIKTKKTEQNTTVVDIEKKDIPQQSLVVLKGEGVIKDLKTSSFSFDFKVEAQTPTVLRVNTFNFPGWKAWIDGEPTMIDDQNKYRLITLNISKGAHWVSVKFTDTLTRRIGNIISFLSWLLVLSFFLRRIIKLLVKRRI